MITQTIFSFRSRGVGSDGGAPCFICGAKDQVIDGEFFSVHANIAAFVKDKEQGEKVHELFRSVGSTGRLDFRPSEPNWVQYKVLACKQHKPHLELLHQLTQINEGHITAKILTDVMWADVRELPIASHYNEGRKTGVSVHLTETGSMGISIELPEKAYDYFHSEYNKYITSVIFRMIGPNGPSEFLAFGSR